MAAVVNIQVLRLKRTPQAYRDVLQTLSGMDVDDIDGGGVIVAAAEHIGHIRHFLGTHGVLLGTQRLFLSDLLPRHLVVAEYCADAVEEAIAGIRYREKVRVQQRTSALVILPTASLSGVLRVVGPPAPHDNIWDNIVSL